MVRDNYAWWRSRFSRMARYFDAYRIDHILGFFRIWEIPVDAVHGLLGHFNPALPMSVEELHDSYGFDINPDLHATPYITRELIATLAPELVDDIVNGYLEPIDDTGRYRLLLQMLHGQADRRAHFHTTITCAFPNGDILQDDGEVEGTIAFAPMGENGFGYDPVFFMPDKRKTFAQLSAEEKAEISHRGKALRAFKETLKNYLAEHQ